MKDLDKSLQEIGQDVKIIVEKVHKIDKETTINTQSLKEHMRRTEASENRIEKIEDRMFKDKVVNGGIMAVIMGFIEVIRRFI